MLAYITEVVRSVCGDHAKGVPIRINKRLTATQGRVLMTAQGDNILSIDAIEFSAAMLESSPREHIYQIILHECAHVIVAAETGKVHHHDAVFKETCRRIGCTYDKASAEGYCPPRACKYIILCSCCGKELWQYSRAGKVVKNPDNYFTKCCNAPLTVKEV